MAKSNRTRIVQRINVCSLGRPYQVQDLRRRFIGDDETLEWRVWDRDPYLSEYIRMAARMDSPNNIIDHSFDPPNVTYARNIALDEAKREATETQNRVVVVFIDDDFEKLVRVDHATGKVTERFVELGEFVHDCIEQMLDTGFRLAGPAPTPSWNFVRDRPQLERYGALCGALMVVMVDPHDPHVPRFDHLAEGFEDTEFTLAHIERYDGVLRFNNHLMYHDQKKLPGGFQSPGINRRDYIEEAVRHTAEKYPNWMTFQGVDMSRTDWKVAKSRISWKSMEKGINPR